MVPPIRNLDTTKAFADFLAEILQHGAALRGVCRSKKKAYSRFRSASGPSISFRRLVATALQKEPPLRGGVDDPTLRRQSAQNPAYRYAACERDGSCFDHLSPCLSPFYCWLPRAMRQQRRGSASAGIFTTAEAAFTTTESTRKQVPCGPGERSRQSHMGEGLPPICSRTAIRFIANTPLATRTGVVSSAVVRAIPPKIRHKKAPALSCKIFCECDLAHSCLRFSPLRSGIGDIDRSAGEADPSAGRQRWHRNSHSGSHWSLHWR
jgi:hypothetical protein